MYLIMECEELESPSRSPVCLVEDWESWYKRVKPDYLFEVYEWKDNEFILVKDYETYMEEGMCLVHWGDGDADEDYQIIEKYPGLDRFSEVPELVLKYIEAAKEKGIYDERDENLKNWGSLSWFDDRETWCYTRYYDSRISCPW